jgi:hypothetical protein
MTMQGVPTLYPNGVSNAAIDSFGAIVPQLWPPQYYSFFTDFDKYNAAATLAEWFPTIVGTGTAVVSDAFGGILTVTNSAADDDAYSAQWAGGNASGNVAETFTFTPGKELWFASRFQLSDVVQSEFVMGLVIADTDPFTAFTDGVAFTKPDGSAVMSLTSAIVTPVTAAVAVQTLVNATFYEAAFHYNGADTIRAFINGQSAGSLGVTALPTTELAVTFGIKNGEAVAKTALIDWIFASRER